MSLVRGVSPGRLVWLVSGLFLYGMAIAALVRASIGLSPWDVLTQGVSRSAGLPFGLVTNLIGVVVLVLWWPLRQRPGAGTVLNVLLIGPAAQLGLWLIPEQHDLLPQALLFTAGLALLACATGIYIAPHLGPGPRDGLMTGLHARTSWPLWQIRAAIELTVLLIGWFLGGQVGIGTVVEALLIGPLVHRTIPLFRALHLGTHPGALPSQA